MGIPAVELPTYWDNLQPFFENFAHRSLGRWTVKSLISDVESRERQVWSIRDFQAVCLTSVSPESVNIDACAGIRRHEWQEELDDTLRDWARSLGKKRIIALVRPGWSKFGKKQGYREAHREMVLEL